MAELPLSELLRLVVWLGLLGVIFIPLERLFPLKRAPLLRPQIRADLAYYFINGLLPRLLLIVPLSALAWAVRHLQPIPFYGWAASLPWRERLLLIILVAEVGGYWGHRLSHEVPWLWRFHAVHHSAAHIDWLVNSRGHPVDIAFGRFSALLPVYVVGLAQPSAASPDFLPMFYTVIATTWSFFVHANVNWRLGWLEHLIATPAFHHWHHTNDDRRHFNKNYATFLPLMDRIFGTHFLPSKRWPLSYGLLEAQEGELEKASVG
ncbi:MAG: sterol desaturase family protein [Cyanobacteria bacterium]|nr:sterol desaturase family protein [Cyanobacteriota bacterium]